MPASQLTAAGTSRSLDHSLIQKARAAAAVAAAAEESKAKAPSFFLLSVPKSFAVGVGSTQVVPGRSNPLGSLPPFAKIAALHFSLDSLIRCWQAGVILLPSS